MSVIDQIPTMNSLEVLDLLDELATEAAKKSDGQVWAMKLAEYLGAASDRLRETIPSPIPYDQPEEPPKQTDSDTKATNDPKETPQDAPESTISPEVDSGHPGFDRTVTRPKGETDEPDELVGQASMAVARLATKGRFDLLQRLGSQITIETQGIDQDKTEKLDAAKSLVAGLWDQRAIPELENLMEALMKALDHPKEVTA